MTPTSTLLKLTSELKRKIDASNQDRADAVEYIDSYFLDRHGSVTPQADATSNAESPAWALRSFVDIITQNFIICSRKVNAVLPQASHRQQCADKLGCVAKPQREDLSLAIDQLLERPLIRTKDDESCANGK